MIAIPAVQGLDGHQLRRAAGWLGVVLVGAVFVWELADWIDAIVQAARAETQFESSGHLIRATQILFHTPTILLPLAIALRRVTALHLMLAFVLAKWAHDAVLFDFRLHELMLSWDVYPEAFWPDPGMGGEPNPQYAKMTLYMLLYPVLTGLLVWGRTRTFHRFFVWLVVTAVFLTGFIFHRVIADAALADAKANNMAVLQSAITVQSRSDFLRVCGDLGYDCYDLSTVTPFHHHRSDRLNRQVQDVHAHALASDHPRLTHAWSGAASLIDEEARSYQIVYKRDGDRFRVAIDNTRFRHMTDRHQAFFSILALCAHGVWLFLGFGVMLFHDWRFARRRRARGA